MRPWTAVAAAVGSFILSAPTVAAVPTVQTVLSPKFQPPAVFKNLNLVRTTNLDKGYVRETVNVVVQNVDQQPQSEYYLPFPADVFNHIGALEVRDKKAPDAGRFDVEAVMVGSSSR